MSEILLRPSFFAVAKTRKEVIDCLLHFPQQSKDDLRSEKYGVTFLPIGRGSFIGTLADIYQLNQHERYRLMLDDGSLVVYYKEGKFFFDHESFSDKAKISPPKDSTETYINILEQALLTIIAQADLLDLKTIPEINELLAIKQVILEHRKKM